MLDTPLGYPPIPYENKAFVKIAVEVAGNPVELPYQDIRETRG